MNAALDNVQTDWAITTQKIETMLAHLRSTDWLSKSVTAGSQNLESGLICLLVHLNLDIGEHELCDYLPKGKKIITKVDVFNSLAHLGHLAHSVNVRAKHIDDRLLPCMYFPREPVGPRKKGTPIRHTHPCVLLEKEQTPEGTVFTLYDCRNERVMHLNASLIADGEAALFVKEDDKPQPLSEEYMSASGFSWFRALLERFKGIFWQVLSVSIMINLVAISAPIFVMLVYDKVIGAHSPETLTPLIVGAFLAMAAEGVLRLVRLRSLSWFSSRVDTIVGTHIFSQLINMPISFTERASVSAQISRIKAFESIRDFFNGPLFLAMVELPFTLLILVAIAIIAGPLAIIPVAMAVAYGLLLFVTSSRIRTATRLSGRSHASREQLTFETFQKMHGLRASGIGERWVEEYRKESGKASLLAFRSSFISAQVEVISHVLFVLAGLSIIYAGVFLILAGSLTPGALIATTLLVWRVLTPLKILCNSISRFEQVKHAIEQVNRLMAIKTESQEAQSHTRLNNMRGHINFSKVGIRYSKKSDPVFTGLSFDAMPGDLIAITGGNGSGKSTILQLISGFYKPQAGNIRIDGVDIRQLDLIALRQQVAYVPQVPHFFSGSIADNLRMADPLVSNEAMKVALNQVDAWEEVCALPHSIETIIGKDGFQLPSGLSYKLNLARAYIKNTPLMLFDELPYALLNSSAGEAFRKTIARWKSHRTVLIVTHREDYIRMADTVVLLTSGDFPVVGSPELVIESINQSNAS